jgi:hypothetical protein
MMDWRRYRDELRAHDLSQVPDAYGHKHPAWPDTGEWLFSEAAWAEIEKERDAYRAAHPNWEAEAEEARKRMAYGSMNEDLRRQPRCYSALMEGCGAPRWTWQDGALRPEALRLAALNGEKA